MNSLKATTEHHHGQQNKRRCKKADEGGGKDGCTGGAVAACQCEAGVHQRCQECHEYAREAQCAAGIHIAEYQHGGADNRSNQSHNGHQPRLFSKQRSRQYHHQHRRQAQGNQRGYARPGQIHCKQIAALIDSLKEPKRRKGHKRSQIQLPQRAAGCIGIGVSKLLLLPAHQQPEKRQGSGQPEKGQSDGLQLRSGKQRFCNDPRGRPEQGCQGD